MITTTETAARREFLEGQIANIKDRIARLEGRVAVGDMGEPETLGVRRGRHVTVGRNEVFLNANRRTLIDREAKLAALEGC